MAKKHDDDFDLVNLPEEARDPEIKAEDFTLQQADESIHEQKFQTKPTTFLKDSFRRFRKNKSSVVAAYILGALILLSIFVPILNDSDVSNSANSALNNLEPKIFNAGGGFWDGTKHVDHCPIDSQTGFPDPLNYLSGGVTNLVVEESKTYVNETNIYGKEGYLQFGYYGGYNNTSATLCSGSTSTMRPKDYFTLDLKTSRLTIDKFDVVDVAKLRDANHENNAELEGPESFVFGSVSVEFVYAHDGIEEVVTVIDSALVHNIGLDSTQYSNTAAIDITDKIKNAFPSNTTQTYEDFYFQFKITGPEDASEDDNVCCLIRNFEVNTTGEDTNEKKYFSSDKDDATGIYGINFTDAMQFTARTRKVGSGANTLLNTGCWTLTGGEVKFVKGIYLGKVLYGSFDYDSYQATLGRRRTKVYSSDFEKYVNTDKSLDCGIDVEKFGPIMSTWNQFKAEHDGEIYVILKESCPICPGQTINPEDIVIEGDVGGKTTWYVELDVIYYRYIGMEEMPRYIFGTDKTGRDMFKYVFEGLRNSLALGFLTFIVCFLFGLLWGAVSGYFGGAVDLAMERVTDILSGIPWIVVMTLIILHMGSTIGTFALALCLTGWIGTASTTRTQFYRFRGREYVLASRTLGASDARLIAKHILPNALGTIITGAVLMIPSVIFSEATISYLGLGFKNLSSLGVILSNNQGELTNHPYQLLFPSAVIALVMISFNLFGNGLRDAINPSLKGEEE